MDEKSRYSTSSGFVPHKTFEDKILVQNLSTETFSNVELEPLKVPKEDIIADIETGIINLSSDIKEEIRLDTKNILEKPASRIYKEAQKSLKQKDCYYVKSDKGNTLVILNKSDYKDAMLSTFTTEAYEKLSKNPLNQMITEVDNILKKYNDRFPEYNWRKSLKTPNPSVPRAYGLPKIHKPGNKFREIIDNTAAPTYRLSKWLVNEFSKLTPPQGMSVKNTSDFVNRIRDITLEQNEILISFDVTALFPSVPMTETFEFLKIWLDSQDIDDDTAMMYLELASICMEQNIFSFAGTFYKQTKGTAMGNCLSPFLANLFMSFFEEEIKNDSIFPRIWFRYVDDIFAIVDKRKIDETITTLNNRYTSINFTYEMEEEGHLPFLDVKIIRTSDNKLEFDIYRKPTNSPRFITSDSFHTHQHKYSAFTSMVHRLLTIPLTKPRFEQEIQYILDLATFNGLNPVVILNTIDKQKRKLEIQGDTTLLPIEREPRKFLKLTYFPPYTNKISKTLKKHNISTALSSSSFKIKRNFCSLKDKKTFLEKSGIYRLRCTGCDSTYIGMTSRSLIKRYKDHEYDVRVGNEKTAISKHIRTENDIAKKKKKKMTHGVSNEPDYLELLKPMSGYRELLVWESIYIRKHRSTVVNDNVGLINSQLFNLLC